jgi:hypothetical protein
MRTGQDSWRRKPGGVDDTDEGSDCADATTAQSVAPAITPPARHTSFSDVIDIMGLVV